MVMKKKKKNPIIRKGPPDTRLSPFAFRTVRITLRHGIDNRRRIKFRGHGSFFYSTCSCSMMNQSFMGTWMQNNVVLLATGLTTFSSSCLEITFVACIGQMRAGRDVGVGVGGAVHTAGHSVQLLHRPLLFSAAFLGDPCVNDIISVLASPKHLGSATLRRRPTPSYSCYFFFLLWAGLTFSGPD